MTNSDKSYVSMETRACVVCGKEYETNALLLDRRLRNSMGRHTCTGWGMCPEHQRLRDDGYIALVAIDPERSKGSMDNPYRTGEVAHLRASVWPLVFDMPVPKAGVCFVDAQVIERLHAMQQRPGESETNTEQE